MQPDLTTSLTGFIARLSEFGSLTMYITYAVPRPYKILVEEKKKCIFQNHKHIIKVVRYF